MDLSAIGMLKLIFDNGPDYETFRVNGYEISFIQGKAPYRVLLNGVESSFSSLSEVHSGIIDGLEFAGVEDSESVAEACIAHCCPEQ